MTPPVCKILDFGKYKYEAQKKASVAKKKQKETILKEIKMRPGTDVHDYNFKVKAAQKFIKSGDKVKLSLIHISEPTRRYAISYAVF